MGQAQAGVVNFEAYATDPSYSHGTIADGYGGIQWGAAWEYWVYNSVFYPTHSGAVSAFPREHDSLASFSFDSAPFAGAWFSGPTFNSVQLELFNAGVLVHTTASLDLSDTTAQFLTSGYTGLVDEVKVLSPNAAFYVMDDVTFGPAIGPASGPSTSPEPAGCTLLGIGAVGALGYAGLRRWKNAAAGC